jgi:hypothetical protein
MWTHILQCECRWRRVRQLHQAMNHTLGTDSLGGEMRLWIRNSIGYKFANTPRDSTTAPHATISMTGLYYPSALLLCDCFPIITPTLCGYYSPCYDIDDRTLLSICVASLQLFPYLSSLCGFHPEFYIFCNHYVLLLSPHFTISLCAI